MKKIFLKISLFFAVFIFSTNCSSQIIIELDGDNGILPPDYNKNGQYYYKDLQNYLDNFVGTWVYINANEKFEIILSKVIKYHNISSRLNLNFYEDGIVIRYKKFVNNIQTFESPIYANPNFSSSDGVLLKGYIFDYGRLTANLYLPFYNGVFKQGGEPIAPNCRIVKQPRVFGQPAKIKFSLSLTGSDNYDRITYSGQPTYSIPNEVIMSKVQ